MGETIRQGAAALDILADARETVTNATARGGSWKTLADDRLGAAVALAGAIEARIQAARDASTPLTSALDAKDDEVDRALGRISDDIWNDVGRPAGGSDPFLSVLLPGGIAYYTEGDVEEQPLRMGLLVELLDAGIHPRLAPEKSRAYAAQVRELAGQMQVAVDAARGPRLQLVQLERTLGAVAKTTRTQLVNLKRAYKSEGHSEAEIHRVIPSRSSSRPKRGTEGGGGPGGGGTT